MPDKGCCCCDHKLYGCDCTQYTEVFSHYCNALLLQASVKAFQLLFSFTACRKHHRFIKFVKMIHPRSSQLWRNSSKLASESSLVTWPEYGALIRLKWTYRLLFKNNKGACWLLQWNLNSGCLESGQNRLFWLNDFRVQIALYVENNTRQ